MPTKFDNSRDAETEIEKQPSDTKSVAVQSAECVVDDQVCILPLQFDNPLNPARRAPRMYRTPLDGKGITIRSVLDELLQEELPNTIFSPITMDEDDEDFCDLLKHYESLNEASANEDSCSRMTDVLTDENFPRISETTNVTNEDLSRVETIVDATNEDLSRVETIVDATVDENAREPPFSIDATNEDLSRVETIDATSLLDTTDATIEDLSRGRNCKAVEEQKMRCEKALDAISQSNADSWLDAKARSAARRARLRSNLYLRKEKQNAEDEKKNLALKRFEHRDERSIRDFLARVWD